MDAGAATRVLLVDDDVDTRRLFRLILETEGYTCVEAGDAATAGAIVAEGGVDLATVDVLLGEDDGLQLATDILRSPAGVAVVMVSGVDDPDLADAALDVGAYGYLLKPVRRSELLLHVANARRRHDLERRQRELVSELESRVAARTADLEQAFTRLEEAELVRSQFIQNVSHELRSPLTVILAGAGLVGRTTDPERLRSIGASIDLQGRRLLELIERLLEVASLDASPREAAADAIDVRGLLALVADPARATGRVVSIDVRGEGALVGSQPRLSAALSHLVENSLRFTPAPTPIELEAWTEGDAWTIRVVDHGPGIPHALRPRLWEPFVQGDGSAVRERGGLGVGLYLCRRLVEWHGGSVDAHDTDGGGLTVVLRLPRRPHPAR